MDELDRPDQLHVDAAEGWLGLGSHVDAFQELEQVSNEAGDHPEVLRVRYHVLAAAKNWEAAAEIARRLIDLVPNLPFGPIHLAYALHEMRRTDEAWAVLHGAVTRFPKEHIIAYNLACYACQMGDLPRCREWLDKAVALAGAAVISKMALQDTDLEPLWAEIREKFKTS